MVWSEIVGHVRSRCFGWGAAAMALWLPLALVAQQMVELVE